MNPENITNKDLNEKCFELDNIATVKRWEYEEYITDVESSKVINLPEFHKIFIDSSIWTADQLWLRRGDELGTVLCEMYLTLT